MKVYELEIPITIRSGLEINITQMSVYADTSSPLLKVYKKEVPNIMNLPLVQGPYWQINYIKNSETLSHIQRSKGVLRYGFGSSVLKEYEKEVPNIMKLSLCGIPPDLFFW